MHSPWRGLYASWEATPQPQKRLKGPKYPLFMQLPNAGGCWNSLLLPTAPWSCAVNASTMPLAKKAKEMLAVHVAIQCRKSLGLPAAAGVGAQLPSSATLLRCWPDTAVQASPAVLPARGYHCCPVPHSGTLCCHCLQMGGGSSHILLSSGAKISPHQCSGATKVVIYWARIWCSFPDCVCCLNKQASPIGWPVPAHASCGGGTNSSSTLCLYYPLSVFLFWFFKLSSMGLRSSWNCG